MQDIAAIPRGRVSKLINSAPHGIAAQDRFSSSNARLIVFHAPTAPNFVEMCSNCVVNRDPLADKNWTLNTHASHQSVWPGVSVVAGGASSQIQESTIARHHPIIAVSLNDKKPGLLREDLMAEGPAGAYARDGVEKFSLTTRIILWSILGIACWAVVMITGLHFLT